MTYFDDFFEHNFLFESKIHFSVFLKKWISYIKHFSFMKDDEEADPEEKEEDEENEEQIDWWSRFYETLKDKANAVDTHLYR